MRDVNYQVVRVGHRSFRKSVFSRAKDLILLPFSPRLNPWIYGKFRKRILKDLVSIQNEAISQLGERFQDSCCCSVRGQDLPLENRSLK